MHIISSHCTLEICTITFLDIIIGIIIFVDTIIFVDLIPMYKISNLILTPGFSLMLFFRLL